MSFMGYFPFSVFRARFESEIERGNVKQRIPAAISGTYAEHKFPPTSLWQSGEKTISEVLLQPQKSHLKSLVGSVKK